MKKNTNVINLKWNCCTLGAGYIDPFFLTHRSDVIRICRPFLFLITYCLEVISCLLTLPSF